MLIVTHEMRFARDVSHRTVFMDGGRIAEQGPSAETVPQSQQPPEGISRQRKYLDDDCQRLKYLEEPFPRPMGAREGPVAARNGRVRGIRSRHCWTGSPSSSHASGVGPSFSPMERRKLRLRH